MFIRTVEHLVGSAYEHMVSKESAPSGFGTAKLQCMCTAVPTKIVNDVMEHMQASNDVITCVMTKVV